MWRRKPPYSRLVLARSGSNTLTSINAVTTKEAPVQPLGIGAKRLKHVDINQRCYNQVSIGRVRAVGFLREVEWSLCKPGVRIFLSRVCSA
jgi:hypothetical protein